MDQEQPSLRSPSTSADPGYPFIAASDAKDWSIQKGASITKTRVVSRSLRRRTSPASKPPFPQVDLTAQQTPASLMASLSNYQDLINETDIPESFETTELSGSIGNEEDALAKPICPQRRTNALSELGILAAKMPVNDGPPDANALTVSRQDPRKPRYVRELEYDVLNTDRLSAKREEKAELSGSNIGQGLDFDFGNYLDLDFNFDLATFQTWGSGSEIVVERSSTVSVDSGYHSDDCDRLKETQQLKHDYQLFPIIGPSSYECDPPRLADGIPRQDQSLEMTQRLETYAPDLALPRCVRHARSYSRRSYKGSPLGFSRPQD